MDLIAVRQLKRGMPNQGSCSSRDCRAAASPNGGISRAGKVAAGGQECESMSVSPFPILCVLFHLDVALPCLLFFVGLALTAKEDPQASTLVAQHQGICPPLLGDNFCHLAVTLI